MDDISKSLVVGVCGGRFYDDVLYVAQVLNGIHMGDGIKEIVQGFGTGADALARGWAHGHDVPVKSFPPDWALHGKAAGPIRNNEQADYLKANDGILICFPGGRGTADMKRRAIKRGVPVYEQHEGTH